MSDRLSDTKLLPLVLPEHQPADLLEQLAGDSRTEGLARLTQRLIAALKIPMQARSNSDRSFGGVSDITNRGNFDRLLLSELAHDDLSLMARLANNEALYLRREELPANHTRQRFILVDTSIKMWGTPRIFAIATALACRMNNKEKAHASTFALQGNAYSEMELHTKSDIIGALAELSPALHSAGALTAFVKEHPLGREQEYFLITDEQLFYTPAFQAAFAHLRTAYGFLITVSRSGQLQLFKYKAGNRHLLYNISLDLPELLSKAKKVINAKKEEVCDRKDLPAFFHQASAPLYFPSNKIVPDKEHMFSAFGVIGITQDQRLLYWPDKTKGAIELMSFISPGKYYFGQDDTSEIYILHHIPSMPQILRMLQVDTKSRTVTTIDCKHEVGLQGPHTIIFYQKHFIIDTGDTICTINPVNGKVYMREGEDANMLVQRPLITDYEFDLKGIKRMINPGYDVLNHIRKIYANHGRLFVDYRAITINNGETIITLRKPDLNFDTTIREVSENPTQVTIPDVNYKLLKFTWDNGSEAFLDSRGFLHLRSANKTIPEVTIVLILNRQIACWSSDGFSCGSKYFTGKLQKGMSVREFYTKYIQSFIEALK
ncbi:hypothetical protein GO495_14085 [Chitinophaga oryziterrae]|uniref:MoxR-vWA-beta-propeller ternary system domain-containing protein n=1 Tax=Chitinophaga oryziterrae TaxID=1031224 RepID=A0A6N8J9R7_9BACT|nr:hypothetical protein [Chitinophaga oryziterrae]MVT41714.1 hypothetical protein [Chitinophaga oryziterrae]